ncbi:MAG: TonB-dependent receptor, partial [Muribaculaceae bacterium]|nr:TonB-dependent receptor [Muribaculaceae bacterium]
LYLQAGPTERPVRTIPFAVDLADRLSMHSLQLLPEVKIAYDFCPALSVGFVWAKGYKAGGYNTQMFSDILQQALMESMGDAADYDVDEIISYKPETSWNYELNFSSHLLDNNLNIDLSTFFIDCRNQQMTVFPEGTTTGRMMANAGRTRSVGFELAVDYRINDHWRIDTSYGLASAKFRQFNDGRADYKGNHVPYAPENTLFGAATYSTHLSAGPLTAVEATVGCRGVGKIWWNEANSLSQPFYATMSASVNLRTKWLDVEIWGENLTDTQFSTFYFVSMRNAFVQRGNPRRFGITLRYNLSFK